MPELQVAGPSQKLRRWGDLGPVFSFSVPREIVPVVIVDDLSSHTPPRPCAGFDTSAATVAQQSQMGLVNPAGSGVIVVLNRVTLRPGTNNDFISILLNSAFPGQLGVGAAGFVDQRITGRPASEIAIGAAVLSLTGLIVAQMRLPLAAETSEWELGFTIGPGTGIFFQNSTLNSLLSVGMFWTETAQVEHGAVG